MNKYKIYVLFLSIFTFVFLGCENLPFFKKEKKEAEEKKSEEYQVTGTVIAKVNDMPITLEELEDEIKIYNSFVPSDKPELKIDTKDEKIRYLREEIIPRKVLYQEALKRGLDKKPSYLRAIQRTKENLLSTELIKELAKSVNVSSQEIEDYYNRFKDQLKEPEKRKVREIVVATQARAREILVRLLQGEDFAKVAKEESIVKSALKGGELDFMTKDEMEKARFKEFADVAFSPALEEGGISNIFKGPQGYYILKLERIKGGRQKTLTEIWDDIKNALTFVKQKEKINGIISKAKIEIYQDKVK